MFADWFIYLFTLVLLVVLVTAAIGGLKAAPYVPTFQRDVRRMLKLVGVKPGELVVDLGAGDGRFLITAAREYQARGLGYEVSLLPWLVAQVRIRLAGLSGRVRVVPRDFFRASLGEADVVVCFLTPRAMAKLEPKFRHELRPAARIASYAFKLPSASPFAVDKPTPRSTPVFVYRANSLTSSNGRA